MSAEIDEYPLLHFQDIRKKPASQTDTRMDVKTVYTPLPQQTKVAGGINDLTIDDWDNKPMYFLDTLSGLSEDLFNS